MACRQNAHPNNVLKTSPAHTLQGTERCTKLAPFRGAGCQQDGCFLMSYHDLASQVPEFQKFNEPASSASKATAR